MIMFLKQLHMHLYLFYLPGDIFKVYLLIRNGQYHALAMPKDMYTDLIAHMVKRKDCIVLFEDLDKLNQMVSYYNKQESEDYELNAKLNEQYKDIVKIH